MGESRRRVGDFEVVRSITRGGMAELLEGRDRDGRRVAIKLLRSAYSEDVEILTRFRREASAMSGLKSEHVVRIRDFGTAEDDRPYIVMELLDGHDLAREIEVRGTLPLEEAAMYIAQACHAVEEAHSFGVIHRDLKPRNLFLAQEGERRSIKVLDFGIAKLTMSSSDEAPVTVTKMVFGSPLYMAPELFRTAKIADARSDVWSLGVVFYEMLTGLVPFRAENALGVGLAAAREPHVPATTLRNELPRSVDVVLARALKKDPAQRYQSVRELMAALEVYLPRGRNDTLAIPAVKGDAKDDDPRTVRREGVAEYRLVPIRAADAEPATRVRAADDPTDAPTRIGGGEDVARAIAATADPDIDIEPATRMRENDELGTLVTGIPEELLAAHAPRADSAPGAIGETGRVAGPVSVSTTPVLPQGKRRLSAALWAVPAAAVFFGVGGWLLGRGPPTPDPPARGGRAVATQPASAEPPAPVDSARTASSAPPAAASAAPQESAEAAEPGAETAAPTASASGPPAASARPPWRPKPPPPKGGKYTPKKI